MTVTSANGAALLYGHLKLLSIIALRSKVELFDTPNRGQLLFTIGGKPLRERYPVTTAGGQRLGTLVYQRQASYWGRAHYLIAGADDNPVGEIQRQGSFSSLYRISLAGEPVMRLHGGWLFGRRRTLDRLANLTEEHQTLLLVSVVAMLLLENIRP